MTIYLKTTYLFVHEVKLVFANQFIKTMKLYILNNELFRAKSKNFYLRFTILNIVKISLIKKKKWNRHTIFFEFLIFFKQYVVKHFICFWTRFNNFVNLRRMLLRWENYLLHKWKKTSNISSVELIIVVCEFQKVKNSSRHLKKKHFRIKKIHKHDHCLEFVIRNDINNRR